MSQRYIGGVVTETTDVAKAPWTGEWTQQAALQGFAGAQAPLRIANSLRFRSSASAYLNRTPSVAGNQKTWTWSGWIKRGSLGSNQAIFEAGSGTGIYTLCWFTSSDTIQLLQDNGAGGVLTVTTSAVFRDTSAWYHVVITIDTTQATSNNRTIIYINGINQSLTYTLQLAQNANTWVNSTYNFRQGIRTGGTSPLDGYLAEINFVDGQALPPTAFGAINPENGVWAPITYTGTYGTNGFRLSFNNGTSTTTLGYDSSGNSNNWTTNNISLTAGSTYDWMIDSPTKYPGSSYGVGNYCVLNPLRATGTIANANLTHSASASAWVNTSSTIYVTSGKWYFEATNIAGNYTMIGVATNAADISTVYGTATSTWTYFNDGTKYGNGATGTSYGASYTTNDVIGVALDMDAGTLTFYKNNVSQGTAFSTGLSGLSLCPWFGSYTSGNGVNVNFGQRPFAYTPPSGFKSLCTQNLPVVTIYNGAQYMAATTYTGTGSSLSVVNYGAMQPDFVWIKSRSAATDHALYDVIRGTQNRLESNTTDAAVASDNGLTAFGSSGFTVNALAQVNTSAATYVGWQWKAGGTAVTNTAGSITSQVSANTTAGFSVVAWTGTGAVGTLGHGLGVAPSMIIVKSRSTTDAWYVYHISLGATMRIQLNETSAATTGTSIWNSTAPTSTVFSIGNGNPNSSGVTYVSYCFAAIPGYSAFGSYTGNGSADGPFVYCGFRPRFVMIKGSSSSSRVWVMVDTSRDTINVAGQYKLYADYFGAENNSNPSGDAQNLNNFDILSNGFKLRSANTFTNGSSETYVYACFAENPFQNALAR